MKKLVFFILFTIPLYVTAQKDLVVFDKTDSDSEREENVSFGLNFGYGQNLNAYQLEDENSFSFFEKKDYFSMGMDLGVFVTRRFRPRLELRYVHTSYGTEWPSGMFIDESRVNLHNVDLNLNLDYKVLEKNRFQLFLSPGFVTEFTNGHRVKNYESDGGSNHDTYNIFPDEPYPRTVAGVSGSAIFKYMCGEHFGFTLTPSYTYFLRKFVRSNSDSYYRYGVRAGVEFVF